MRLPCRLRGEIRNETLVSHAFAPHFGGLMARIHKLIATVVAAAVTCTAAIAEEPISLRAMGSFHVGGRLVEISGKPVKEVTFTPGGVPAKVDPHGTYQVEQMYVQYFLPANERGAYPLLMWHGGGLTGVTYETTPDGREGWLNLSCARAGVSTIPMPSSAAAPAGRNILTSSRASRCFSPPAIRSSVFASA